MTGKYQNRIFSFILIGWIVCNLALLTSNNIDAVNQNQISEIFERKTIPTNLEDHSPIFIDSNDDFDTLNFSGEGTEIQPYIIANLNISASGAIMGIEIHTTNVFFEIWNCTILTDYVGIRLYNIAAGTAKIINNICISKSGDGGGIGLGQTSGVLVSDNECANFIQGVHLNYAHDNNITNNIFSVSNYQGINIRYSNNNIITYNNIQNSQQHGLALVGTSYGNTIHHNTFINNSLVEDYLIDGERSGTIGSQGYDEGSNNIWYEEDNEYGNHWSDYNGKGDYDIDGPAGAKDIYPLMLSSQESVSFNFLFIVIVITSTWTLMKISRKRK